MRPYSEKNEQNGMNEKNKYLSRGSIIDWFGNQIRKTETTVRVNQNDGVRNIPQWC